MGDMDFVAHPFSVIGQIASASVQVVGLACDAHLAHRDCGRLGPANGAKKRQVLIESLAELEPIIQSFTKR